MVRNDFGTDIRHPASVIAVSETRRERRLSWLGRSALAGAVGGIGLGVGLRVAMRLAAIFEGQETGFSFGGTFFILLVGSALGLVFGILYGWVRRWVPGPGLLKGALFGFALAVLVDALLLSSSSGEARTIGSPLVNALTFGGSVVLMGVGIEWAWSRVNRRQELVRKVGAGSVAGAAVGIATALLVTALALARWVTDSPEGFWPTLGMVVLFALEGLLLGGVLGLLYGLAHRDGWRRPLLYSVGLVALWLLILFSAGDDGMTGPDATEITVTISVALAGFGAGTAWLTGRLLGDQPVLVTLDDPMGI